MGCFRLSSQRKLVGKRSKKLGKSSELRGTKVARENASFLFLFRFGLPEGSEMPPPFLSFPIIFSSFFFLVFLLLWVLSALRRRSASAHAGIDRCLTARDQTQDLLCNSASHFTFFRSFLFFHNSAHALDWSCFFFLSLFSAEERSRRAQKILKAH